MYNNKKNIGELVKLYSFIDKLNIIDNKESNLKDSLEFYFLGNISSEELVKEFPRNIEVLCELVNKFLTFDNAEEKMYIVSPDKVKEATEYAVSGAIDKYNISLKCNTITEEVFLYKNNNDNIDERFYQYNEISGEDIDKLRGMTLGDWCYIVRNNSMLYNELYKFSESKITNDEINGEIIDLRREIGSGYEEIDSIPYELCFLQSKNNLVHRSVDNFLNNSNGERNISNEDLDMFTLVSELPKTKIVNEDNFTTYGTFMNVLKDYNDSLGTKGNVLKYVSPIIMKEDK